MWCPRWRGKARKRVPLTCCYEKYVDFIIALVEKNPKLKLIFRPHPQTDYSLDKIIEAAERETRISIESPEINYQHSISCSNAFISDPSTMIPEAFVHNIPIIYTETIPDIFTDFGNEIQKSFYIVKNKEELSIAIEKLMKGEDDKKILREEYIRKFYEPYKEPCKNIIEVLQREEE